MGDPFSAAGTAVGITSLGIQTCQIIHKYYSDFKSFHEDIDNVLRQAEGLEGILESLHQLKDRLGHEDYASSSQLQLALIDCEDALHALKRVADKCAGTKQSGGFEARVREVRKRLLWPYKKETIADLQGKLDKFKSNLSLAVQSAGLDGMLRKFDGLEPVIAAVQGQTADMKQDLTTQTQTLSALRLDVADAALVRHQHHEEISSGIAKLLIQTSQQHAAMDHNFHLLMTALPTYQTPSTVPPSLLADSIQQLSDVHSQTSGSLLNQHQRNPYTTSGVSQRLCTCHPRKRQSSQRYRWISFVSTEAYRHRPTCPYSAHADRDQTFAAQFSICNGLVSFCVQAGWQRSKRGGWNSIAPVLRYRAVVPRGTGAFGVLRDAKIAIQRLEWRDISQEQLTGILTTTTTTLQRAYRTYASPYDIDEDGRSLLYEALGLIDTAIIYGMEDSSVIQNLLDVCSTPDVFHIASGAGDLPPTILWQLHMAVRHLSYFQRSNLSRVFEQVLCWLAQRSGSWSIQVPTLYTKRNVQQFYISISTVLASETMMSCLDEDDPLLLAILRRSEAAFETCISKYDAKLLITSLTTDHTAAALVNWPTSVQILSSCGLLEISDFLVTTLWRYALQAWTVESVRILIMYKKSLSLEDWFGFNMLRNRICIHQQKNECVGTAITEVDEMQWAADFDALAAILQPDSLVGEEIQDENIDPTATGEIFPYHSSELNILGAESAWKAGYRDLNTIQWYEGRNNAENSVGTPLWIFSLLDLAPDSPNHEKDVIRWLLTHGADPFWTHPQFLTTPAHNLVRQAVYAFAEKSNVTQLSNFESFMCSQVRDCCACFCSKSGCCCIGCAISLSGLRSSMQLLYGYSYKYIHKEVWLATKWHQVVHPYLFDVVDRHKHEFWMSSAVLRVKTFENLGLTHTCCYRIFKEVDGKVQRPTEEEAEVIHEHERDDIELLDELVAEFEAKWATYDKPFVTFMNRVWRKRMKQVKEDRQVDQETYQAELLRMGVTLDEPNEDDEDDEEVMEKLKKIWLADDSDSLDEEDSDWPDEYESEDGRDGWYTTDDEGAEDDIEERDEDRECDD